MNNASLIAIGRIRWYCRLSVMRMSSIESWSASDFMVFRLERTTSVFPAAAISRLTGPPPFESSIIPLLLSTTQQPRQPSTAISLSIDSLMFAIHFLSGPLMKVRLAPAAGSGGFRLPGLRRSGAALFVDRPQAIEQQGAEGSRDRGRHRAGRLGRDRPVVDQQQGLQRALALRL